MGVKRSQRKVASTPRLPRICERQGRGEGHSISHSFTREGEGHYRAGEGVMPSHTAGVEWGWGHSVSHSFTTAGRTLPLTICFTLRGDL